MSLGVSLEELERIHALGKHSAELMAEALTLMPIIGAYLREHATETTSISISTTELAKMRVETTEANIGTLMRLLCVLISEDEPRLSCCYFETSMFMTGSLSISWNEYSKYRKARAQPSTQQDASSGPLK